MTAEHDLTTLLRLIRDDGLGDGHCCAVPEGVLFSSKDTARIFADRHGLDLVRVDGQVSGWLARNKLDGPDRRDTARDVVVFPLSGEIATLNLEVTMIESSHGGFSIRSPRSLPIGSMHHLEFTAAGHPLTRTGRVVHVTRHEEAPVPVFTIGFASESDS